MTTQILSVLFMLGLTATAHAALGPGSSGGGKGVVCRNADGSLQSVELLDLWEARQIYGAQIIPVTGTLREALQKATTDLGFAINSDNAVVTTTNNDGKVTNRYVGPEAVSALLRSAVARFVNPDSTDIRRLRGVRLAPTTDAMEAVTPIGCNIEQIVRFDDLSPGQGSVLLDQDLFDKMDLTNQAALITHEGLYKFLRESGGELTSLRVRRTIGLEFSGYKFESLGLANLPSEYYVCQDLVKYPHTQIFAFPVYWTESNPAKRRKALIFQAVQLDRAFVLASPRLRELPNSGGAYFDSLSDLSSLVRQEHTLTTSGIVQLELRASVKIVAVRKNAMTVVASAEPSMFFPDGVKGVKLSCELKRR